MAGIDIKDDERTNHLAVIAQEGPAERDRKVVPVRQVVRSGLGPQVTGVRAVQGVDHVVHASSGSSRRGWSANP